MLKNDITRKQFYSRIKEFPFIKKQPYWKCLYTQYPHWQFKCKGNNLEKDVKIVKCSSVRFSFKKNKKDYANDMMFSSNEDPKKLKICNFYWIPVECFYSPLRVSQVLSQFKNINLEVACKHPQFFCQPIEFMAGYRQRTNRNSSFSVLHIEGHSDHFFEKDRERLLYYINGGCDEKPEFPGYVINAKRSKVKFADIKESLFK